MLATILCMCATLGQPQVNELPWVVVAKDKKSFALEPTGLPKGVEENYVYEYDREFKFIKTHVLKSGYTLLGIQTATFANGHFWFGCYGGKLLKADPTLKLVGSYDFNCSLG